MNDDVLLVVVMVSVGGTYYSQVKLFPNKALLTLEMSQ
jgi:hypothetical protein